MQNLPLLPNYIYPGGSQFITVPIGKSVAISCLAHGFGNVFVVGANGAKAPCPVNPNVPPNKTVICTPAMFGTGGATLYVEAVGGTLEWAVGSPPVVLSNITKPQQLLPTNNVTMQTNDSGTANGINIVTKGATLAYAPGDSLTAVGGSSSVATVAKVLQTTVLSAAIVAGGTGGTNGGQQISGTTGTGDKVKLNVTIAGGIVTAITSIYIAGRYTVNPTNVLIEPMTGAGLTGCTVSLVMGVNNAVIQTPGLYTALPTNPVSFTGGSGGTGFTANLSYLPPIPQITVKISPSPTVFATSDIVGGEAIPFGDPRIYVADSSAWFQLSTGTYGILMTSRATIGYQATKAVAMGVIHDGTMIEFIPRMNDIVQFFVDQNDGKGFRLISPYSTTIVNGTGDKPAYVKLNFGTRGVRKIIMVGECAGFIGCVIEPLCTLGAYDFTNDKQTWGIIGTSYGQKPSDAFPSGSFYDAITRLNGIPIYKDCEASSGYNVGNGASPHPFITRLNPLIAVNPQNVLIDGPINDVTGAGFTNAVSAFYDTLFSALPNANYLIYGAMTVPSQLNGVGLADTQARSAVVLNELLTYPNMSWVFMDVSTGTWTKSNGKTGTFGNPNGIFTGTGWVANPMNNGNSDIYISDGTHPNPAGANYIGDMVAGAYCSAMNAN